VIRIRVYDSDGNSDTAVSSSFAIFDSIIPIVSVSAPNGLERWSISSKKEIRWTASDNIAVVSCSIFVSTNNRIGWTLLHGGVCTNGSGVESCSMPNELSDSCWIRIDVYDAAGNNSADTSDQPFQLVSRPYFNCADSIEPTIGTPIRFQVTFEIPDSGTHSVSINKIMLPDWAVFDSGFVKGTPESPGLDTIKLELEADDVACDTLILRILVKEPPVISKNVLKPMPLRFDISVNAYRGQGMAFVVSIEKTSDIGIKVYDISGKELWTYHLKGLAPAYHTIIWNQGGKLSNGTYIAVVDRSNEHIARKILFVQ
jgi:hypothetical protein